MLDNICSLPLTSDIFTHAVHPTEPAFSVGLSAGHVETFRLPAIDHYSSTGRDGASARETSGNTIKRGRRLSGNGFDMVESVWRTRRHKGSCRSLAYSWDGETLYSAGTDGLIKAASTATGKVSSKIAVAQIADSKSSAADTPSVLRTLSPTTLLVGSDAGYVYVYDLRTPANSPSGSPSQCFRPHATPEDQSPSEAISSLTFLPPSSTSTSGTSRLWISTSGSTLAATDLRKGVVAVSDDQGDVLMSSVCLPASNLVSKRPKDGRRVQSSDGLDRIIVGGMSGAITTWDRGVWTDRVGRYAVGENNGRFSDDQDIDQLAVVPEEMRFERGVTGESTIAAGLSSGRVAFVKIHSKRATPFAEVSHDEGSVDGITTLGFDVAGRMITGGGQLVKIWREKSTDLEGQEPLADDFSDSPVADNESSDSDEDVVDAEAARKTKRKRKRSVGSTNHGDHGVMAFQGMD